jgi:hypothetical protein
MAHGQILGLFNGVVPLLVKDLTFVMCKFAIFDITKQRCPGSRTRALPHAACAAA